MALNFDVEDFFLNFVLKLIFNEIFGMIIKAFGQLIGLF